MRHAAFWGATWRGFAVPGVYKEIAVQLARSSPALAMAIPIAALTYVFWPRTRYFGNSAPLLVALLFIVLGMAHPHVGGAGFILAATPFLFIFVSGVLADLMETANGPLVTACVFTVLGISCLWTVIKLAQVPAG